MYAGFGTPTASPAPLTATAAAMPTSFPVATNPPIPRGMPNNILVLMGAAPKPVGFTDSPDLSGGSSAMLAKRDAMVNRLRVFTDYRVLSDQEANRAVDRATEMLNPKRGDIDAFLSGAGADEPVPSKLLFSMDRYQAQELILAYLYLASSGSQIYENGMAEAKVQAGEWSDAFLQGDLDARHKILDFMAAWDREGVIDRAFSMPDTPYGGLGNPWVVGTIIGLALIAAGLYYLVTTTNIANEQKERRAFLGEQCAQATSSSNELLSKACIEAMKWPKDTNEALAEVGVKVGAMLVVGMVGYSLFTYGFPHLFDWWMSRPSGSGRAMAMKANRRGSRRRRRHA